jgi:hypothetical protein
MEISSKYFLMLLPLLLINLILLIVALVDIIKRDKDGIKGGNKLPWILLIVVLSFFGPLAYLLLGRKQ